MCLRLIILSNFLFVSPLNAVKYDKLNPSALYERAVKYLDKEDYSRAIRALKSYTKSEPEDADGWNLYAFAHRKVGKFEKADEFYKKSLALDPNNISALEYQGELFVQTGMMDLAEVNLNKLKELCTGSCLEYEKLKEYISNDASK